MKIGAKNRTATDHSGPITAANYAERAKSFIASSPKQEGFVIRSVEGRNGEASSHIPATEPQWIAWIAYFDLKEIKRASLIEDGIGTVPCEWPEDFDVEAWTSDRGARLYRPPAPDLGERQRVIDGFAWLKREIPKALAHMDVSSLRDGAPTPPKWRTMTPQDAENRLNDPKFREKMSAPVQFSDRAKQIFTRELP